MYQVLVGLTILTSKLRVLPGHVISSQVVDSRTRNLSVVFLPIPNLSSLIYNMFMTRPYLPHLNTLNGYWYSVYTATRYTCLTSATPSRQSVPYRHMWFPNLEPMFGLHYLN